MSDKFESELLKLLENSYLEGEPVTIFHILSEQSSRYQEIGRLAVSGNSQIKAGHITLSINNQIFEIWDEFSRNPSHKQISEFLLKEDGNKQTFRIVAEVMEPPPSLCIFGAGHVGQSVAMIGALAGYSITVVDDRAEFLTLDRFPNSSIRLIKTSFDKVRSMVRVPGNSAMIIVTRGHQFDETCLKQVLNMETRYIGMIGSRRRVTSIFQRLIKEGVSEGLLQKVHAPIGLKIGAVSPQEIAIAIMAEIIQVMRNSKPSLDHERRQLK